MLFCGLGGGIADKPAMYYGIIPLTISISEQKLESAFKGFEINRRGEK